MDDKFVMPYEEAFRDIIQGVEMQLKLHILIPSYFREYGIRVIERWWKEGYTWYRAEHVKKFLKPHA